VLSAGKNLVLEIEVDGAAQIHEKYPDALFIMLLPPSFKEQEERLRNRKSEDEETIQRRLRQTREEMKCIDLYDYVVYNRNGMAKEAAEDILAIVRAEKCARRRIPDIARRYFAGDDASVEA
jgi:guanylate kinase